MSNDIPTALDENVPADDTGVNEFSIALEELAAGREAGDEIATMELNIVPAELSGIELEAVVRVGEELLIKLKELRELCAALQGGGVAAQPFQ